MIKNLHLNLHRESEIIFSSLRNLSDNGVALFIVSPNFLITKNKRNIYEFLKAIGFSLEGIFYIPAGVFKPFRIGIELRLIIIKKKIQPSKFIFEGEIIFY